MPNSYSVGSVAWPECVLEKRNLNQLQLFGKGVIVLLGFVLANC